MKYNNQYLNENPLLGAAAAAAKNALSVGGLGVIKKAFSAAGTALDQSDYMTNQAQIHGKAGFGNQGMGASTTDQKVQGIIKSLFGSGSPKQKPRTGGGGFKIPGTSPSIPGTPPKP